MTKIFCRTCGKQNIPGLFHQCTAEPEITAIKEVLAQPSDSVKQGPVAGLRCKIIENCKSCQHSVGRLLCALADRDFDSINRSIVPPEWCPLPLYTAPPKRKWVGLTGDDMDDITSTAMDKADAMLLTEAKLKEKNHAA